MQGNIGPYQLQGELGRGAMARVWRAWDPNLQREVAIKEPLFDPRLPEAVIEEMGRRFVGEGRAAASLSHAGIVTIYAADVWDGRPAIVMELIDGETLSSRLRRGAMMPNEALSALDQLLDAVGYAHAHGVVHRDIKPDNIFITRAGQVKLADFGIAHVDGSVATMGTIAGTVLGTPGYMSPEQATGAPVDARSDLFSVGAVAYEMLSGRNPFGAGEGVDATTLIYRIVHEPAPELPTYAVAGLPADLRPAIMAALSKDPANRPQDAQEFRAMLHGLAQVPSQQAGGRGYDSYASTNMAYDTTAATNRAYETGSGGGRGSYGAHAAPGTGSRHGGQASYGSGSYQQYGQGQSDPRKPSLLPYLIVAGVAVVVLGFVLINALGSGGGGGSSSAVATQTQTQTQPEEEQQTAEETTETPAAEATETSSPVGPSYYLAVSEGKVAIFSNSSATPYEVTDVEVADLGSASAAELDAHVPASSVEEAEGLVAAYRQEADATRKVREEQAAQAELEADIAAHPFVISYADASSYLSSVGQASHYEPACVLDDDFTTSWNEGIESTDGLGEWLCVHADSERWIHGISLVNGYPKTQEIYYKNNRCREVLIELSDGYSATVTLADSYREWQTIDFGDYHKTSYVRITILSVYGGSTWKDTSLCEIRAY